MNWDRIQGNWKEFKGKAREQWGKLTNDQLDVVNGRLEILAGKLQESYGMSKDEAERAISNWSKSLEDSSNGKSVGARKAGLGG